MTLSNDIAERAWRELEAELKRRLDELGPGWAVGWRLKEMSEPGGAINPPIVTASYEFHTVEIIDGRAPVGLVGFQYVVLREGEE